MRVGVYIDGFNLYYGARGLCGRGAAGWRWLDLRALSSALVMTWSGWADANVTRVVYCTARISGASNPSGARDQDVYLRALQRAGSVDELAMGTYVTRVASAPLATPDKKGRPVLTRPQWPIVTKNGAGVEDPDTTFIASIARREEKASDVNVASHLLLDVLQHEVDAAVIVSNDSDLEFPVRQARLRVPVGTVNPTKGFPAGRLNGAPGDGVGSHWWHQLRPSELQNAQLPAIIDRRLHKPQGW